MDKLDSNALANIFIHLDTVSVVNCSEVCQKFKKVIDTPFVWERLLQTEYSDKYKNVFSLESDKQTFIMCHNIQSIKDMFGLEGSIEDLYRLERLDLSGRGMNKVPLSLCSLINLKELNLENNEIVDIPLKLSNLTRTTIWLFGNKIKCIPESLNKNIAPSMWGLDGVYTMKSKSSYSIFSLITF